LNKQVAHSLSAQLFCGVLLSLLAAAVAFVPCFFLGNYLLERTVYGEPFMEEMSGQQFSKLQNYVTEQGITEKNLHQLNVWCSRGEKVYLTVYLDNQIAFVSFGAMERLMEEDFDILLEDAKREYALTLSDGTLARAFLYYYAGDAFYYWVLVASSLISFIVFSLCFITFVHRKLRYIKQLKSELDILAGGDLSYQVTVKGEDELAELASGIDQMRQSITAHQEAEEKMRSANSQLVTAMSHDLRTPLTSLLAYLELIERGKYENDRQLHHFISRSLEKTMQIKSMADKLFEYFLVYSSEWEPPNMETVDAGQVFQQFWGEYAISLENQGFIVQSKFSHLDGLLRVNLELLRRSFDNLYANLLKYADPAGPVEILCCREEKQVHLTLTNRVSPRRNTCESTNIGLKTCSRIIQFHGGNFEVTEESGVFRADVLLPLDIY